MSATQGELGLKMKGPKVTPEEIRFLLAHLYAAGGWRTRRQIMIAIGMSDRTARACAEQAKGHIIFGQSGMKHMAHATSDEKCACVATLAKMEDRLAVRRHETEKAWHGWRSVRGGVPDGYPIP